MACLCEDLRPQVGRATGRSCPERRISNNCIVALGRVTREVSALTGSFEVVHDSAEAGVAGHPRSRLSHARLRGGLLLLGLVTLLNQMDRLLLSTLAEPIRRDLNLSDTQLGLLTGLAFAIFYAFCGVPLARLADRSDRPRLLSVCLLVWTLASAVSGFVANFTQLLLARIVVAIGEAGTQPAGHTLIADYFPETRRASSMAVMAAGGSLGAMGALAVGGMLAEAIGWRATIAVIGLAGIPVAIACWLFMPEPRRNGAIAVSGDRESALSLLGCIKVLVRSPTYLLLTATATLSVLPGYAALSWAPAFFMRTFGLSVGEIGLRLGLLTGVGTLTGHMLTGWLSDRAARSGPGRMMTVPLVTVLLLGPTLTVSFMLPSATLALAFYFIPVALSIMWYAPVFASIQTTTPPKLRAQAAALTLLISNMCAIGVGPTVVGIISDALRPQLGNDSLRLALIVIANLSVFGAVAAFFAARSMCKDALRP